jgi:2-polyprenyl-3-methyl-5-hydroxy-6-metoxy-1,4-benzoquinol methylase
MNGKRRDLWDDPRRDYRLRYRLPDQFTWDAAAWPRIDFDGYTSMAFQMLPAAPARVLDVGCGPGAGSARLLDMGYDVTGVDYNERAVGFAGLLADGGTFTVGDIRRLDEVVGIGAEFDAAVCIEVLEHVPPEFREDVLRGVHRLLRPGGTFVITTPNPRMPTNVWDYRRDPRGELERSLSTTGFDVVAVRFQHRLSTPFDPRVWRLVSNRWYDLRVARHVLRRAFLSRWNEVDVERRAGRSVITARR